LNVERRIADYPDLLGTDRAVAMAAHLGQGLVGDLVALEVMVAEAAEGEVLIQAIMAQLQASAVAHVARQQAHGHAAARLEAVQSEEHTSELQSRSDLVCRL